VREIKISKTENPGNLLPGFFFWRERLAQAAEEGHVKITPDLAVEVISPNDKIYDLEEKLEDYWSAGVKLVWAVIRI
jgi:Uma2 family endonuclease